MTTVFVFPGLNSLHTGIDPAFLLALEEVRGSLRTGLSLAGLDDDEAKDFVDGLLEDSRALYRKDRVHVTAVAISAIQLGLAARLARDEKPDWVTGYSLGDTARSVFAGAAHLKDVVDVTLRATLQDSNADDLGRNYLVVSRSRAPFRDKDIAQLTAAGHSVSVIWPSILNVSSSLDGLAAMRESVVARRWHIVPLMDFPVHSDLLPAHTAAVGDMIRGIALSPPAIPLFSTQLCRPVTTIAELVDDHIRGLTRPCNWCRSLETLVRDHGITRLIDIGPDTHTAQGARMMNLGIEVHTVYDLIA